MENQSPAGYIEREHAADWELEVWAPDLPGLLAQAAQGMNALMGLKLETSSPIERHLSLPFQDVESLLVAFLNELLYYLESENLAFQVVKLQIDSQSLNANLLGASVISIDKEIKAATYHNLQVHQSNGEARTRIVLDV